jgi:hypothetical protein
VQTLRSDYSATPSTLCSMRHEPSIMQSSNKKPIITRVVTISTEDEHLLHSQHSIPLTLDTTAGYVKPIVKSGWNNPTIHYMPPNYVLERSHRILDLNFYEPSIIMANLSDCFRNLSLWVKYAENPAGAALLSLEQIEMYVYLWNLPGGQNVCVEVQNRRGDSLMFHNYARHILDAASGAFDEKECMENDVKLDLMYLKEAEKSMKIECARVSGRKESSFEPMDYVLKLISDGSLAGRIRGMESLCILTDIRKTTSCVVHNITRCILFRECNDDYGKIHDLIFHIIQKRCMPDEDEIMTEMVVDYDSDDEEYFDDEDYNSDKPSEYQEAMRCLIMLGFTILAHCSEAMSIAESCRGTSKMIDHESSGSRCVAKVLQAANSCTHINLLSTLLEVLEHANSQPHNASKAATCLKVLCRLSQETQELVKKNNALDIILRAQDIGLASHFKLEKESRELFQSLHH